MGWAENIAGENWCCSKCHRGFASKSMAENHERSCGGGKKGGFCGKMDGGNWNGCPHCKGA